MKTLKKVLSVALVLAMALSLVTLVGAANVSKYQDFTDADAIVNKEAVDTLVGLRVLDGLEDGSFGPEGYLTRAQAAAVIARMLLGRTVADSMVATTAPFADVPANHWAAKYIQYCVSRGIINGMGDNTFVPNGEVTAAQFAKMLLVAAGYGKKGEYVGADWAINAIVDAQNLGILDTNVDYMAPATRDLIARYAFNFYTKVAFVSYSKDIEDYVVKTVKINTEDVPQTLAVQQGVETVSDRVIGGVTHHKYVKNDVDLTGNYFAQNFKVLATYADGTSFYAATTPGTPAFKADKEAKASDISYYYNGTPKADVVGVDVDALIGTAEGSSGTRGVVVQLIDTNNNKKADVVVVTQQTVAEVLGNPYTSKDGKTVYVPGVGSFAKEKVVGYEGLKLGDVVLYHREGPEATGVTYIEKAQAVTGKLTGARTSTKAITFAGATYYVSGLLPGTESDNFNAITNGENFNVDATIYLDKGGNVVKFVKGTASAPVANYLQGLVVGYQYDGWNGTAAVKLVKEDGTVAVYSVAAENGVVPKQADKFPGVLADRPESSTDPYAYLVNYELTDDGKVKLVPATEGTLDDNYSAKATTIKIKTGETSDTYYVSSTTKIFYFDVEKPYSATNKVTVVTGYSKTVEMKKPTGEGKTLPVHYFAGSNKVLSAMMFGAVGEFKDQATKVVFVASFEYETVYSGGGLKYQYTVYEKGEELKLLFDKTSHFGEAPTAGLYALTVEDGVVTKAETPTKIKTVNKKTVIVDPGYIILDGGDSIMVNANTKFFMFDKDDSAEPIKKADTIGVSQGAFEYTVTQYVVENGFATEVYFTFDIKAS